MKKSGSADLALMGGSIPSWLFERMKKLSLAIIESILVEKGHAELLSRMSDPFWFQSFGAVIGMDWNSSGVTTAVTSALKQTINPHAKSLGLYVCGGKGSESRKTPEELLRIGDQTGLDGIALARSSKLSAKVDNTAVQDGFQLYLHSFLLSNAGDWTVIQQGMNPEDSKARRYHWHSEQVTSFIEEPHAAIVGENQGEILNLVDRQAAPTKKGIMEITAESPDRTMKEVVNMVLPGSKGPLQAKDVDLKRLSGVLKLADQQGTDSFEELLLLKGMGPRTIQSLTLVSEVIHGTPSRFKDPARFAMAYGSKGGMPFPVPTKVYDESISMLRTAVDQAKIGQSDKQKAIQKLSSLARKLEERDEGEVEFDQIIEREKKNSWKYGGRTMKGFEEKPEDDQLSLF